MKTDYINLLNKDLSKSDEIFTNIEPRLLSFDENVFFKLKNLNNTQRKRAQSIFKECLSYTNRIPELKKILKLFKVQSYTEKLLSNLIISSSHPTYLNSIHLKYGICSLLLTMKSSKKRELKSLEEILFFNITIEQLSNKKLLELYKKISKNIDKNKSIAMSLLDNDEYDKVFNENTILEIKKDDITNEILKRSKLSKSCELLDKNDVSQGSASFIPKREDDDIIIVIYENVPYTVLDIKKKKLFTKKIDGKIAWN